MLYKNLTHSASTFPDVIRVPDVRSHIEAHSRGCNVPLPGGKGAFARPPSHVPRRMALRRRDLEV